MAQDLLIVMKIILDKIIMNEVALRQKLIVKLVEACVNQKKITLYNGIREINKQ